MTQTCEQLGHKWQLIERSLQRKPDNNGHMFTSTLTAFEVCTRCRKYREIEFEPLTPTP